jgi:hypothetical protein
MVKKAIQLGLKSTDVVRIPVKDFSDAVDTGRRSEAGPEILLDHV